MSVVIKTYNTSLRYQSIKVKYWKKLEEGTVEHIHVARVILVWVILFLFYFFPKDIFYILLQKKFVVHICVIYRCLNDKCFVLGNKIKKKKNLHKIQAIVTKNFTIEYFVLELC